jgi:hypothetical protein
MGMAKGVRDECLVRVGGGLEWKCKIHLDTVYTTWVARYQPKRPQMYLMSPPRLPIVTVTESGSNSGSSASEHPTAAPASAMPPVVAKPPMMQPPPKPHIPIPKKTAGPGRGIKRKTMEPSPLSQVATAEDGTLMKKCSKHKRMFPVSDFDEKLPGQLYGHCRKCQIKR